MASVRVQQRIDRLLDQADEAMDQLDWGTVRDCAQAVLGLDPENNDANAILTSAGRVLNNRPKIQIEPVPKILTADAPPGQQPTSFANGRYVVKSLLGEGGKKMVYLAYDNRLDRDVALALIKTEGLNQASRTRINREAQAMGRLGANPNPHIVTVFDLGDQEGQPFMVTELMSGGDVEGLMEDASDHRLSLEQTINITREICMGLAFAHSRNIVHRDLKPGNVWLTSDGVAKIGDFGLALVIGSPRLTAEGTIVGTVSYMSPEQVLNREVTPQSDLYSLGAMLYEMVTGRPPFMADKWQTIMLQHTDIPPVAPSRHNPKCPLHLEALILRLLAKEPADRPPSAAEVLVALEAIELTETSPDSCQFVDDTNLLDGLAEGLFVGREPEMRELKAALEDALSGKGRLVMLAGEPGIGKTRTAQELTKHAEFLNAQVLWGRCDEDQGMPPYWPWVQALRSYVNGRDAEQLRSEMGAGAADIAEMVGDLAERLPDLKPSSLMESPEQARFRMFDSIAAFLKTLSQKQPVVLVLDDLQWADQPSLLLLQFVARELGGARVLVLGTYRDMELSRHHRLAETLGELTRETLFRRIPLRGLSQQDVGRFIENVTDTVPQGLVHAVYTQTEGNPFFSTEVVRMLVQEGDLTLDQAQNLETWSVRIPEGVREVIGRRLNRLSQGCNDTLTIAAVIGREFTLDLVKHLIEDVPDEQVLEFLEEALSARLIEELPHAMGQYQFIHAMFQETLTEELTLTRRVRLHARIAETWERLLGDNAEAHAAELAHHFVQAEAVTGTQKLVHYSLLAGDRALKARAYEEALAQFQRGLTAKGMLTTGTEPVTDTQGAALLTGLGQAQVGTHDRQINFPVLAILTRAFDYYVKAGNIEQAVAIAAYHLPENLGREIIEKALELVRPDSHDAGRLQARYITPLRAEYEKAQEAFKIALSIAQQQQDPELEMRTLVSGACVDFTSCQFQYSLEKYQRSIELAGRVDLPVEESHARYDLAQVLWAMGDLEGASLQAEAMSEPAERSRIRFWQARAMDAKEHICSSKGDWRAARGFSDQGLALLPRDPILLGCRALLEHQVGNFEAGGDYLKRLLDIFARGRVEMSVSCPDAFTTFFTIPSTVIALVARITGEINQLDHVEAIARSVFASPFADPSQINVARIGLALTAVQRGDAIAAEDLYGGLEKIGGIMSPQCPMGPGLAGDHVLGLLAQTTGNFYRAVGHFEKALAFCRKGGYRPELAWICCDYADTLRKRNYPRDREDAIHLLEEALTISSVLGMLPLTGRALSRMEILKA